jgi:ribosome-binding protein aMBF1 (putative translation factor)
LVNSIVRYNETLEGEFWLSSVRSNAHVPASKKRSKFARRAYQPDEAKNAVGDQLRRVRCALGWSQEDLAARCHRNGWDMDRVMVAKIELHLRSVTDLELLKLCETTGATPGELLGLQPLPTDEKKLRVHLRVSR